MCLPSPFTLPPSTAYPPTFTSFSRCLNLTLGYMSSLTSLALTFFPPQAYLATRRAMHAPTYDCVLPARRLMQARRTLAALGSYPEYDSRTKDKLLDRTDFIERPDCQT